ncbi:helix-turn-helix domain-containing protein [Cesiribacter andamanensis]|uniref:DNA-binding transcriptional regulator AraC n=1 Tax=Cesiribacter andamanensis AMV16 TaxID=1279009 RepID=M7NB37_9BACT|nr:helix-turn-helix domain-containing protein [Cesiribacter andamanensis]EMR04492.1 DNA-binding transcriptional regulator AraC [Cesiribacter andamanensis AMV16]
MTTLHIKNMVCNRCIKVVREVAEQLGFTVDQIGLGELQVKEVLQDAQKEQLAALLLADGFELLDDRKATLVEKIKGVIIREVHHNQQRRHQNLSVLIADELHMDYSYLSNLFSSLEGTTIEKYTILQRIEKVKELLVYDELTLSEIAWQLGYSSVHHLSAQFKKVTGLTPSHFKKIGENRRKPLDGLQ